MTKYNFCWRTGRPCKPGAFDGGDGVSSSIDCASGDPVTCGWRGPQIINATPHVLRVLTREETGEGEIEGVEDDKIPRKYRIVAVIPPSGIVVRATPREEIVGSIPLGIPIPILKVALGDPTGLPAPQEGTFIFVSRIAAEAAMKWGRNDLLFPGRTVRNQHGEIIGILSFGTI
jgi:hypothetical protein